MNTRKQTALFFLLTLVLLLAAACSFADSPNSTMGTAASIDLNQTYQSSLGSSSDRQYYKFVLNEPGVASLSFSHEYLDSSSCYWATSIMDSEDEEYYVKLYYDEHSEKQ